MTLYLFQAAGPSVHLHTVYECYLPVAAASFLYNFITDVKIWFCSMLGNKSGKKLTIKILLGFEENDLAYKTLHRSSLHP